MPEPTVLLVGGGDPFYLCYWMRQSGLADLLPELGCETVYVGVSGGSMVLTPISGEQYDGIDPLDPHHWRVSVMPDQAVEQRNGRDLFHALPAIYLIVSQQAACSSALRDV